MATKSVKRHLPGQIESVRHFNRFYTQQIGVLRRGLLHSPFSLTEVRVLYELAAEESMTAADLMKILGLDAGYLSRILRGFRKKGLVERSRSKSDGRQNLLRLTAKGRKEFGTLNARQDDEVREMLEKLAPHEQPRLVNSMRAIHRLLDPERAQDRSFLLRPHRSGDLGWVVYRHGVLYAREYGWNEQFEAVVARIVADFIETFDARRERCWIAEQNGARVGSVFLVKKSPTVAQLRLLLVEPEARGHGIGTRLVQECIEFARHTGYRTLMLWTNGPLAAARRVYERAGFRLVKKHAHHSYGKDLVGQFWEMKL